MSFTLIVDDQVYPIQPEGMTVGRTPENQVVLPDPTVSRKHATLWVQDGQLYIRDEASANGTWLNGQPAMQISVLRPGDTVGLGRVQVRIGWQDAPSSAPSAVPPTAQAVPASNVPVPVEIPGGVEHQPHHSQGSQIRGVALAAGAVALVLLVAAGLVWALGRRGATSPPALTPTVEPTVVVQAGPDTPIPPATVEITPVVATSTPIAAQPATPPSAACLPDAEFVADVTVPDRTRIAGGESFAKVWRVRATGCRIWDSGAQWVFVLGDQMEAPAAVVVPQVPLNSTVDITVTMRAPLSSGSYLGYWQMADSQGQPFGDRAYVQIESVAPTAEP